MSAFRGCDGVINCAGPFTSSGEAVVRAAIAAGCHYVDTSGEQLYVKKIFDTFTTEAENAGVTVVPAANDGCVPVDLMAHILADRLEPVEEIVTTHVVVGGGGMSRGSLRSVVETIDAIKAGGMAYHDGDWRPGMPARHTAIRLPGQSEATPVMAFPVSEVVTIPRHIRVRHVEGLTEAALGDRLNTPSHRRSSKACLKDPMRTAAAPSTSPTWSTPPVPTAAAPAASSRALTPTARPR